MNNLKSGTVLEEPDNLMCLYICPLLHSPGWSYVRIGSIGGPMPESEEKCRETMNLFFDITPKEDLFRTSFSHVRIQNGWQRTTEFRYDKHNKVYVKLENSTIKIDCSMTHVCDVFLAERIELV